MNNFVLVLSSLFVVVISYRYQKYVDDDQDLLDFTDARVAGIKPGSRINLNDCNYVDMTALATICEKGQKLKLFKVNKYYSEKVVIQFLFQMRAPRNNDGTRDKMRHSFFFDDSGHVILGVHRGNQFSCCSDQQK